MSLNKDRLMTFMQCLCIAVLMPFITEMNTDGESRDSLRGGWQGGSELWFVRSMSSKAHVLKA